MKLTVWFNNLRRVSKELSRLLFGIVFCLTLVSLHKNFEENQYLKNSGSQIRNESLAREAKQLDKFLWSSDLRDWTLVEDQEVDLEIENDNEKICIWPEDCDSDRIVDQLLLSEKTEKIFKILPPQDHFYPEGEELFVSEKCSVDKCRITYNRDEADALLFLNSDVKDKFSRKRSEQIWIAYMLESPINTFDKRYKRFKRGQHVFNWTASYRSDSDIVTPYSKYVPYFHSVKEYKELSSRRREILSSNFEGNDEKSVGGNKEGKVAWFVSNCNAGNKRLEYAKELSKHIQVDIFGKCGNLTCYKWNETGCLELINERYKFFLSFENSNCHQYITEKLYKNALGYNDLNHLILPIVMGPSRSEYESLVPPSSFIHVDDFNSPEELAKYLKLINSHDSLYYSFFRWKQIGKFIDTKFMCRVCAMLHASHKSGTTKTYENLEEWWNNYTNVKKELVPACKVSN